MTTATILAERIREGRSTIVLGILPSLPSDIRVVRIRCDLPGALGPLDRARDRIERQLDGEHGRGRPDPLRAAERFASACNRFASQTPGPAVLVLDAIDRTDPATHRALAKLLRTPGALDLPLVLVVRNEPNGSFLEVVNSIEGAPAPVSEEKALDALQLDVVRALIRAGDVKNAVELLTALDPKAPPLRARALLERARLRWLGAGIESSFSLAGALDEAIDARDQLGDAAPPSVRADAASVIAGIAYDLGDGASIERASNVLAETVFKLLRDGAANEAHLLMNDQAGLALRIGNARKAKELAARSLEVVGPIVKERPTDTDARADLADTHHLLARMPLHRCAHEDRPDAVAVALSHAAFAEAEYEAMGFRRDLGRIFETKARLAAMIGEANAALEAFRVALHLADEAADLTGLARITAGLADLFADTDKAREGLQLVNTSIELNREKGSAIGLAFDERTLARVEDALGPLPERDAELRAEIRRTRERLTAAIEEGTP